MTSKVVWCLGVYSSASTWLFNVIQQMARVNTENFVKTHFVSKKYDLSRLDDSQVIHIVKSHEIEDQTAFDRLCTVADKIVISLRDPRDAVTSLMLYHRYDFDRALLHVHAVWVQAAHLASSERSMTFRYESLFFEEPETLSKICYFLNFNVADDDRSQIFLNLRRSEVEKHISGMNQISGILRDPVSGDRLDPETHWHTHHAGRNGEIGRWEHMLNVRQLQIISGRFDGLIRFQ